jgi:hypothetical protein
MAAPDARLRLAIAVFEDEAQRDKALAALLALGLETAALCCVDGGAAPVRGNAGRGGRPAQVCRMALPPEGARSHAAACEDAPPGWAACVIGETGGGEMAGGHRPPAPAIGAAMMAHLEKGAFLLMACLPSASLQDQAVRVLLRFSRHPVHAEEIFIPGAPKPA